jgi:hypothetical protein
VALGSAKTAKVMAEKDDVLEQAVMLAKAKDSELRKMVKKYR